MDSLKLVDWLIAGLFTFGGAFFGSWLAARYAQRQREEETAARRRVLGQALRFELAAIPDRFGEFSEGTIPFRPPIHLPALDRLLDGETIDYSAETELCERLLNLQVAVSVHNDYVGTINLTQHLHIDLPDGYRGHLLESVKQQFLKVVEAKNEVLGLLPATAPTRIE